VYALSCAYLLTIKTVRAVLFSKFIPVIETLFFDVFLQRRLHRRSLKRWLIHGLIFFPFVFRFVWGMVGLFTSIWLPERSIAWSLLDKNHPAAAFLFDLTGIMILLGVIFAFLRDSAPRADRPSGLPARDRWALGLIGGIVGIGFILEAMRIAMTGWPSGAVRFGVCRHRICTKQIVIRDERFGRYLRICVVYSRRFDWCIYCLFTFQSIDAYYHGAGGPGDECRH
jgi:hypothetical protein